MALTYQTPGVYIEEIPKFPPSIAPVETAIPAFIGYTQKADDVTTGDLKLKPTRIKSLVDYERYFGKAQPEESIVVRIMVKTTASPAEVRAVATLDEKKRSKHLMYYALQMFFANRGGPCYIVSVDDYKAMTGALVKTELEAGLTELAKEDEPTLIVFPEAQGLDIADFKGLHDAALAQCQKLGDRFVIMDVHGGTISMSDPGAQWDAAVAKFRKDGIGANSLKYGAAYGPNLETILDFDFDETKIDVIVDTDGTAVAAVKLDTVTDGQKELAKAAIRDLSNKLPAAAAIAGVYASVDNDRGVWKAPANLSIANVIEPVVPITDADQEGMNVDPVAGKSVNAIRDFVGQGTLVWGARTLAGNDLEWRYVNVRRFFNFVEESVRNATRQFVFEINDINTWIRVQAMIENFLTFLWRGGALQGIKPEHAFFVSVGLGKTMTAVDILEGRMIVDIGLAAVRPCEFIILRFSQKMPES